MEFCARRDGSRIYPRHRRVRRVGENRRGHHGAHFESTGTSSSRRTFRIDGDFVIAAHISNRRGLHVPNERWRGPDETVFWFFCRRSFFFFWCFFNAVTSVCASSSSVSSKPLATTALARSRSPRRRDPGSNPGSRRRDARLSASFTYRVVLLILVGSTPLDRVRCGTRPGVDVADPPRAGRGGYSSRTTPGRSGRSHITIDPSSTSVPLLLLGSLVVPRAAAANP